MVDTDADEVAKAVDKVLTLDEGEYREMRDASYAFSREFDIFTNIDRWVEVVGR